MERFSAYGVFFLVVTGVPNSVSCGPHYLRMSMVSLWRDHSCIARALVVAWNMQQVPALPRRCLHYSMQLFFVVTVPNVLSELSSVPVICILLDVPQDRIEPGP